MTTSTLKRFTGMAPAAFKLVLLSLLLVATQSANARLRPCPQVFDMFLERFDGSLDSIAGIPPLDQLQRAERDARQRVHNIEQRRDELYQREKALGERKGRLGLEEIEAESEARKARDLASSAQERDDIRAGLRAARDAFRESKKQIEAEQDQIAEQIRQTYFGQEMYEAQEAEHAAIADRRDGAIVHESAARFVRTHGRQDVEATPNNQAPNRKSTPAQISQMRRAHGPQGLTGVDDFNRAFNGTPKANQRPAPQARVQPSVTPMPRPTVNAAPKPRGGSLVHAAYIPRGRGGCEMQANGIGADGIDGMNVINQINRNIINRTLFSAASPQRRN